MSKKNTRKADFVFGIILILISFWFGIRSAFLFKNPFGKASDKLTEIQIQKNLADWYNSPGLIPLIFSVLLFICAVALLINAVKELKNMKIAELNGNIEIDKIENKKENKEENFADNIEENVEKNTEIDEKKGSFFEQGEFLISVKVIGLLGAYLFILIPLFRKFLNVIPTFQGFPFLLATFVYLGVFIIMFNEKTVKKIITSLIVAAAGSAAITIGFGVAAKILLP